MKGILIDANYDIQLFNGSMAIGDTTTQNMGLLLALQKGELKEHPLIGVGVENYLNEEDGDVALIREAKKQFKADGMTVTSISLDDGKLLIDANYDS